MERQLVEVLAGQRDAHADRETLPERTSGHIDPRKRGRRMTFQSAPKLSICEEFFLGNRAGRLVHGVQKGRSVALRKDEMVVVWILRIVEVVPKVLREQDSHQI